LKKIGSYEILGLLGKGGMARVYKVRHPASERIFALKLLFPHPHLESLLGWEEIEKRFGIETNIMMAIHHPNIVKCLDQGTHEDRSFIVMEYYCHNVGELIGETYRIENPSRPLRPEQAIRYVRETLHGLAHLHQAGIVHRDIKPFNLLLNDRETIKITDFGLSKSRGEVFANPPQLIIGSPYYAAPEQEKNPKDADPRSDLYSVGVMLYRMLTGWLPMDDREKVVPASKRNPELGSEWDNFFFKSLAAIAADRHQSADNMLQDLDLLEKRWHDDMFQYCIGFQRPVSERTQMAETSRKLRGEGLKIRPGEALRAFALDRLWRPSEHISNDFHDNGNGTVSDAATGMIWQKFGSRDIMTWHKAHAYIEKLNKNGFAGVKNWRLPTIEELVSILTLPTSKDQYCIEEIFDRNRRWLWSSDRASFTAAWYVNVTLGYVAKQDFTCQFCVRAVSTNSVYTH